MSNPPTNALSPSPAHRVRVPWTAIPLLVALAYAGVRWALGHDPSLETMVPGDAILAQRWKDVDTYDRVGNDTTDFEALAAQGKTVAAASASLGADLNIPGLPGVDRSRPIVQALLPFDGFVESKLVILPVKDGDALRAKFRDPTLVERHARHLEIHGDWAASCADRRVVRDAGSFWTPLPPSEGEDWCVTANWPAFVDFASRPDQAANEPFASVLVALGFDPASAVVSTDEAGTPVLRVAKTGRVPFVRNAWSRVTLRSFPTRVVVELEPAEDAKELRSVIAAAKPDPADDLEVSMPSTLEASLHVRGAQGRRIFVYVLGYAGLHWPEASAAGEFKALRLDAAGSWSAWAEIADSPLASWNVALAAPKEAFPDLATLGRTEPSDAGPVVYSAGSAALTTVYGSPAERSTFLPVGATSDANLLVTVIGPKADVARAKAQATVTTHARSTPGDSAGRIEVATFTVAKIALQRLLGNAALGPMGLFASLADHAVTGRMVVIGGSKLRIELDADVR